MFVLFKTNFSESESAIALADEFLSEGISASGLSGQTDGGSPGPSGGSAASGEEEDQQTPEDFMEADVLAFSGSGPLTTVDSTADMPWDRGGPLRRRKKVAEIVEHEGYLIGHPTDATQTGVIQITILDSTNLKILAPSIIYEQVEAYKFFSEFMRMLPLTPMLNINMMESISSWWRNFAEEGDLLEIDCTSGFATVSNSLTGNFYGLGSLGTAPTSTGIVS